MSTNFHKFLLLYSERNWEEAGIKTPTSPQICCRNTLRKVCICIQLHIRISENSLLMSGDICFVFIFYIFIYVLFLPDAGVITTSLRYLVCCVSHIFYLWR